jgi:diguanylate cyclase (GGDEF)-like protein/PAS domain S-box-containing protein
MWDQLVQGNSWRGILVNKRKNNELYWEESFIAPLRGIDGATTHYFAVKIDVSARRLAEEKLLESQAHLQASHDLLRRLSQHIPGVIFQYRQYPDGTGCVPYASEGIRSLFKVELEQIKQDASAMFAMTHPDDIERVRNSITQSAENLTMWTEEYRITLDSGETRWLSCQSNPMRLEDDSVLWHGFISDVTERKILERTVHDQVLELNTILDNSSVGVAFVRDRHLVWANLRMGELFGYSVEEVKGQSTRVFYPTQESFDTLGEKSQATLASGNRYIVEQPMRRKDGKDTWMRLSGKLVDHTNPAMGSIWVFEDITEQKRIATDLQLAANVFTHAREGIMITDAQGIILDVNDTFATITGYARDEVIGKNPRLLNSGRQGHEYYVELWRSLLKKGHWYGEVWNRRKSGEIFAEMQTISAVRDEHGVIQNFVSLFSDITPMKEHEHELEHIAHYDALTQLPNRVLLADRLQQAMFHSQRRQHVLAVVFMDLDGFKSVNDTHGHATGDTLLIEISQQMKSALREGDTLARIGGDEFVAILADLEHVKDCEPVLTRMLAAASERVSVGSLSLQVSVSMGVTFYPQEGADADLLLRQADQAMYAAKQAGKNRYYLFDVAQDSAVRERRESIDRISQALSSDEFVLYYQPKVNMRTEQVVGVEALIRWQHPLRGLLAPAEFLPAIDDHPVSVLIGEWVIRTALTQMATWLKAGFTIPVSVNVGARQLQQDGFASKLKKILTKRGDIDPMHLQLEVLESNALHDINEVGKIMNACHEFGVTFALDDFGTGYSSLTYLKHLPAHTLKIDQSFVRDMLEDSSDLAIVNGVIGLARAFGREVIAEGVETMTHRDMLLSIGCDVAQGYGVARPMPADKLTDWIVNWQIRPHWVE